MTKLSEQKLWLSKTMDFLTKNSFFFQNYLYFTEATVIDFIKHTLEI